MNQPDAAYAGSGRQARAAANRGSNQQHAWQAHNPTCVSARGAANDHFWHLDNALKNLPCMLRNYASMQGWTTSMHLTAGGRRPTGRFSRVQPTLPRQAHPWQLARLLPRNPGKVRRVSPLVTIPVSVLRQSGTSLSLPSRVPALQWSQAACMRQVIECALHLQMRLQELSAPGGAGVRCPGGLGAACVVCGAA